MPGHAVRPYTEPAEQQVRRRPGQTEGRLGHPGVGDRGPLRRPPLGGESRRREHRRHHRPGSLVQESAQGGERDEQLAEHARPLAALPGEQECGPARLRRLLPYVDPGPGGEGPGLFQPCPQLVRISGHDRHLDRTGVRGGLRRQVPQGPGAPGRVVLLQPGREPRHSPARGPPVAAAEAEQLGRPLLQAVPGLLRTSVTGQHRVVVGPAEAEGAHPGDPPLRGHRPGPGLGVEGEGAGLRPPGRVRCADVQGRRPHARVDRPGRLDQPGQSGRALGVPEL